MLWPKEGNSARRHSQSFKLHPDCHAGCPSFTSIGNKNSYATREATKLEIDRSKQQPHSIDIDTAMEDSGPHNGDVHIPDGVWLWMANSCIADKGQGVEDLHGMTSTSAPLSIQLPQIPPLQAQLKHFKTYRLLFVPDLTRQQPRAMAEVDLSWTNSRILENEMMAIKSLEGCYYLHSKHRGFQVLIHEWVSVYIIMMGTTQ
jgi:hypothetical protein